ncbi:MAG: type II toxin-antitoxin system HicA family toxin [Chloroflexi bacterium]|nr:type II toxin-antitoxin system HicA family toxin [Chloroflexota bacterium]
MSSINYGRLRSLSARRLIQALRDEGFFLIRQRGSHHCYGHEDGRRVTCHLPDPGTPSPRAH